MKGEGGSGDPNNCWVWSSVPRKIVLALRRELFSLPSRFIRFRTCFPHAVCASFSAREVIQPSPSLALSAVTAAAFSSLAQLPDLLVSGSRCCSMALAAARFCAGLETSPGACPGANGP